MTAVMTDVRGAWSSRCRGVERLELRLMECEEAECAGWCCADEIVGLKAKIAKMKGE